ncbi:unnamed protein product [Brassica oleracea]
MELNGELMKITRCRPTSLLSIMKKFWESIHKKRPQMEKAMKTFERVNTSKGGRAIPEDQKPGCFFFVAGSGPWIYIFTALYPPFLEH